jgi:cell division septation protein DedD
VVRWNHSVHLINPGIYKEYSIMAKAKATSGTKTGRTKSSSNPTPEAVSPSVGNEPTGQKPSDETAMAGTNKAQGAQPQSEAESRVPAREVIVAASGTTPVEKVAEAKAVPESKIEADAKSKPETKPSAETKSASEPRKLEVVKTDARKNTVVPINLEDEIRRRAYELYVQRGSIAGNESEDWLRAEREVRQRYQRQQSA